MKKIMMILMFTAFFVSLGFGFDAPAGSVYMEDFYSPFSLASGTEMTSSASPQADNANPSASALLERTTANASYLILPGFGEDTGSGHIVNVGGAFPTNFGVLSAQSHFVYSSLQSFLPSTLLWNLNGSFSKEVYDNFLVGAGLSTTLGKGAAFDWGLSMSLGATYLYGDYSFMKNLRFGAAFSGLGKSFSPDTEIGIPSQFTPSIGGAFDVLEYDKFKINVSTSLGFPAFQDIRFSLATHLDYDDTFGFDASFHTDLRELTSGNNLRSLIPSFGITYNYKMPIADDPENSTGTEIRSSLAAAPLYNGIWAIGGGSDVSFGSLDREPPVMTIGYSEPLHISPNDDNILDILEFDFGLSDTHLVMGYRFVIQDVDENPVYEEMVEDVIPEGSGFMNFFKRLFYTKKGIDVPTSLDWDGMGMDGQLVSDGLYTFFIESWDDLGNRVVSDEFSFTVDNTPPALVLTAPEGIDLIFSPDGDGYKDSFTIPQSGTREDLWTASILNSEGLSLRDFSWEDTAPADLVWDGLDSQEVQVIDGVYSFVMQSTDKAGNSVSSAVNHIVVNTAQPGINLRIDKSYFSPNGDGRKDTVLLDLDVPVVTGIVDWRLEILNATASVVKSYSLASDGNIPEEIEFLGRGSNGRRLPEGSYTAKLSMKFTNGYSPVADSPVFVLDLTAPQADTIVDYTVFSPNSDGVKDVVTITQETSIEDEWQGVLAANDGRVVREYSWVQTAARTLSWDGRSADGTLVEDGLYVYTLSSMDKAGNLGVSTERTFEMNTEETSVFLTTDKDAFSPNGDGIKDSISILPQLRITSQIESYELTILDESGNSVKVFRGTGAPQAAYEWRGIGESGTALSDGVYTATIDITYINGNNPGGTTGLFVLDTLAPEVVISTDNKLFSPNGDGTLDSISISQTSSYEELWSAEILNAENTAVRSYSWTGELGDFVWDGSDEAGNVIADGLYVYKISSTDLAGNSNQAFIGNIAVDTVPTPVFVNVNRTGFSPNGDSFADTVSVGLIVNNPRGISDWSLDFMKDNQIAFSYTAESLPARYDWDGKDLAGNVLEEGMYTVKLSVNYLKGDHSESESEAFRLDTTAPEVSFNADPKPFSPDGDGDEDLLNISFSGTDISRVADWELLISDSRGNPFKYYSGIGAPNEDFSWDGLSENGGLVESAEDYPYELSVRDALGNNRVVSGEIPVDVLVMRVGDELRILISNITFAPYSSNLTTGTEDTDAKNQWILSRISEILKKYPSYRIVVEGHALNGYLNPAAWQREEEKMQPLSLERAQSVVDTLIGFGIPSTRLSAVGRGGTMPIVSISDSENRWRNRRVEFILLK